MIRIPGRPFAVRVCVVVFALTGLRYFTPPPAPICLFHRLTGRPCPLCGLTRAVFELAKGHWQTALAHHALSPLAVVMFVALLWNVRIQPRLWNATFALFAAYGLCRLLFPTLAAAL